MPWGFKVLLCWWAKKVVAGELNACDYWKTDDFLVWC
jgi:hypothetical protein